MACAWWSLIEAPGQAAYRALAIGGQSAMRGRRGVLSAGLNRRDCPAQQRVQGFALVRTADRNIAHQQSLAGRSIALVRLPINQMPLFVGLRSAMLASVIRCLAGHLQFLPPLAQAD